VGTDNPNGTSDDATRFCPKSVIGLKRIFLRFLRRGPREMHFHFGTSVIYKSPGLAWEPNSLVFWNILDVFSIQNPKSTLFGRIDKADPASYKNPCSRHLLFHHPQRLITHGSHCRDRHLYPLRPYRQAFVSRSSFYLVRFAYLFLSSSSG
jgi:hypothetical protein